MNTYNLIECRGNVAEDLIRIDLIIALSYKTKFRSILTVLFETGGRYNMIYIRILSGMT